MSSTRLFALAIVLSSLCMGCSILPDNPRLQRDVTHEIKSGETLFALGERYGVPAEDIQKYNDIQSPQNLRIGQLIVIPAVGPLRGGPREMRERDNSNPGSAPLRMVSLAGVRGYVGSLEFPVEGYRYSSRFGWRWRKFHEGIDLAAPEGAPVVAAHDGKVVLVADSWGGYGKVIVLRGDRFMTVYGHNSKNRVSQGDRVEKGERIADVGQTGDASGPHLHFETRVMDERGRFAAVNPLVFYP